MGPNIGLCRFDIINIYSAQNKMGDYFYYGIDGTTNLEKAVFYYSEAAKKNEAQVR